MITFLHILSDKYSSRIQCTIDVYKISMYIPVFKIFSVSLFQGSGSHGWNQLLSEVRWPGLEEEGTVSESSDIDSYSDDELAKSDSVDIATDSEECSSEKEEQHGGDMTRWRHTMDLLHTSTPQQQCHKVNKEGRTQFTHLL